MGEKWSKQVTCKGCKAVLKIEEEDLKYEVTPEDSARDQYNDEVQGTFYIDCCLCEQRLVIKSKDVPKPVAERVKDK